MKYVIEPIFRDFQKTGQWRIYNTETNKYIGIYYSKDEAYASKEWADILKENSIKFMKIA